MADRKDVPLPVRVKPDLLRRIDDARGDVSRTRWVTRAIEAALKPAELDSLGPSPSPERVVAAARASVKKTEVALEVRDAVRARNAEKVYACPKAGCMYVSSEPGVCVHHRTERLR